MNKFIKRVVGVILSLQLMPLMIIFIHAVCDNCGEVSNEKAYLIGMITNAIIVAFGLVVSFLIWLLFD